MDGNPFVVLGVHPDLIAREAVQTQDSGERLVSLAEAYHGVLAKMYHPDRPDGDSNLMSEFNRAIELIRYPGAAEMYADELLDGPTRQRQQLGRAVVADADASRRRLRAVLGSFAVLDQRLIAGVSSSAKLFVQDGVYRYELDVTSATTVQLKRFLVNVDETHEFYPTELVYEDDQWRETFVDGYHETHAVTYATASVLGAMTLVGSFTPPVQRRKVSSAGYGALVAAKQVETVSWSDPEDAWYLDKIQFGVQEGDYVVIRNDDGQLALLGMLMGVHEGE